MVVFLPQPVARKIITIYPLSITRGLDKWHDLGTVLIHLGVWSFGDTHGQMLREQILAIMQVGHSSFSC